LHEPAEPVKRLTSIAPSLIEELEAVDWPLSAPRLAGTRSWKSILYHNMNEEIEHASMALEWIGVTFPSSMRR
jgi:hypothetical protein